MVLEKELLGLPQLGPKIIYIIKTIGIKTMRNIAISPLLTIDLSILTLLIILLYFKGRLTLPRLARAKYSRCESNMASRKDFNEPICILCTTFLFLATLQSRVVRFQT